MDYHPTVEDYLDAKLRLFSVILPADGTAVVDMDDPHGASSRRYRRGRAARRFVRIGAAGSEMKLTALCTGRFPPAADASRPSARRTRSLLPLAGAFQASNALVAAGLAIGAGVAVDAALEALAASPVRRAGWNLSAGRRTAR